MSDIDEPGRRLQFSLRRLLLWTVVAALAFGLLSVLNLDFIIWAVLAGWFAMVAVLRWIYGEKLAIRVSVTAGMLLYGGLLCSLGTTQNPMPNPWINPLVLIGLAIIGGMTGGMIGFVPCLLIDVGSKAVNWIDRIGQSDE